MSAKSVILVALAVVALLVCIPVVVFVFTHLKEGYNDAERAKASRPPETAPAVVIDPPTRAGSATPRSLAEIDFNKLDFSRHTTDFNDPAVKVADNFPKANGSGRNGTRIGAIGQGKFEVRGGIESQTGASWVRLPSSPHSGGVSVLEVAVEQGSVRAYLQGLKGHFVAGSIFADASPGQPARLIGYLVDLSDTGTAEQHFMLESRDGEAREISYRVYRKE